MGPCDVRALFEALAVGLGPMARQARIGRLLRCCARHVRRLEDGDARLTRDHAAILLRRIEGADDLARKSERVKIERAAREREAEVAGAIAAGQVVRAWLKKGSLSPQGMSRIKARPALGRPPGVKESRPRRAPRLLPD